MLLVISRQMMGIIRLIECLYLSVIRSMVQVAKQKGFLMNNFSNCTFTGQVVRLDHGKYTDCIFQSCTIEYGGEGPITLVGCTFNECEWKLVGAAINTIVFLRTMYSSMGEFGEQMVENTFNAIKSSKKAI